MGTLQQCSLWSGDSLRSMPMTPHDCTKHNTEYFTSNISCNSIQYHISAELTQVGLASGQPLYFEYLQTRNIICHSIIIITNSQTSRAARSLNSVVTYRGVPAYYILLSIPRDHGTSTRVFRWRLCHEGLIVCLSWISLDE